MVLKGFKKIFTRCCSHKLPDDLISPEADSLISPEADSLIPPNKGEFLINNTIKAEENEGITFVCTFSRALLVPIFFKAFNQMDLPKKDIHLLVYDNTQDFFLKTKLLAEVEPLVPLFKSVRLFKSNLKGQGSISGSGNEIFEESVLFNIWSMWLKIKDMIFTKTFFQLEDDTIAPPDAFTKLFFELEKDENIGLVTGIETGRNPYPWVPVRLGVHYMKVINKDDVNKFKILERQSLHPDTKGVVEVDGTGVYCMAVRTKAWLDGFDGFDPVKHRCMFFAMDNTLVWNMKLKGWKILADFSIWCSHLQASAGRIVAFSKDQALEMGDVWLSDYNSYAQGVEKVPLNQKARSTRVRTNALTWEM